LQAESALLVRRMLIEPCGSHPWRNFWRFALNQTYPGLGPTRGLSLLTSSCSFQLMRNSHHASLLQLPAFAAWGDLGVHIAPPPTPAQHAAPNAAPRRRPLPPPLAALTLHVDGSYRPLVSDRGAACAFVAVTAGDGDCDTHAIEVAREWAPVEGAHRNHNVAEIQAGVRALEWLIRHDAAPYRPVVIRFDSQYAEKVTLGFVRPQRHVRLARRARQLWSKVGTQRAGHAQAKHVAAHSGHVWNDLAHSLANAGPSHRPPPRCRHPCRSPACALPPSRPHPRHSPLPLSRRTTAPHFSPSQ
jgi:ribonuclease HI